MYIIYIFFYLCHPWNWIKASILLCWFPYYSTCLDLDGLDFRTVSLLFLSLPGSWIMHFNGLCLFSSVWYIWSQSWHVSGKNTLTLNCLWTVSCFLAATASHCSGIIGFTYPSLPPTETPPSAADGLWMEPFGQIELPLPPQTQKPRSGSSVLSSWCCRRCDVIMMKPWGDRGRDTGGCLPFFCGSFCCLSLNCQTTADRHEAVAQFEVGKG